MSKSPARQAAIRFAEPFLCGQEQAYISKVFEQGHFSGNGPFTKQAQAFLEDYFSIPHVLLTHSCTAALEMSALLLDIKPGDQVLLPSYNFVSAASAFLRAGAELVFCEIDPQTMNIDCNDVAGRITPRSRAVIPVHYGGIAADLTALTQLADEYNLLLIEDAAQALAAKKQQNWLGSVAPLATISFHETKNIHCGLGGALFINDPAWFARAEDIWERGTNRSKMFKGLVDKYSWVETGSSFYPTELQAAFLLAQLHDIERNQQQRKKIYEHYAERLQPLAQQGRFSLPLLAPDLELNYHSFFVISHSSADCNNLREHLAADNIQAFIGYVPLHSSKMGRSLGYKAEDLPLTEEYAQRVLRLPFHNNLNDEALQRITDSIARFYS